MAKNWLDKYENGGEYLGTTNKGFNYNGAWGGPSMQMGGNIQPPMAGAVQTLPMYQMGGYVYPTTFVPQAEMGTSLPGSVGFTYARTQGIPSEGPYGKKTVPSAQNGQEMQFYQQGLDWTPRNISEYGSEIPKAQKGLLQEMLAREEERRKRNVQTGDIQTRGNQQLKTEIATQKTKEKKAEQKVQKLVQYKNYDEKVARRAVQNKTKAGERDLKEIERVETRAAAHPDFKPGISFPQMQALSDANDLRSMLLRGANLLTNTGNPVLNIAAGIASAPGRAIANVTTDAKKRYYDPISQGNVLEGVTNFGLDLFDIFPNVGAQAVSTVGKGAKSVAQQTGRGLVNAYDKVATGNSFIPYAWKMEKPLTNTANLQALKNLRNLTDEEARVLNSYLENPYNIKSSPEDSKILESIMKKNYADLSGTNQPITRIQDYYVSEYENPKVAGSYGETVSFPQNEGRSWSLGRGRTEGYADRGKQRLVIPSKYAKQLEGFHAIDYADPRLKFNVSEERELFGNVPEGFKVIGKSNEEGFQNIFLKPIKKLGGVVKDNNGYWNPDNWGRIVEIDSPNITMKGVNQDLIGVSDEGDVQYMEREKPGKPGKDYKFKGKKVKEYPVGKYGVNQQDEKTVQHLDQLLNFTNKPKAKNGWLSKYE